MLKSAQISNDAAVDLIDIWLFGANRWSIERADSYIDGIKNVIEHLGNFPEMGTAQPLLDADIRTVFCGRHVIIYSNDDIVVIRRIMHQSSGWLELEQFELFGNK